MRRTVVEQMLGTFEGKVETAPEPLIERFCKRLDMPKEPRLSAGWHPIATAPKFEHLMVRDAARKEWQSYWGKTSHVPLYGWLVFEGGEECDLSPTQPVEWRYLTEEEAEVDDNE